LWLQLPVWWLLQSTPVYSCDFNYISDSWDSCHLFGSWIHGKNVQEKDVGDLAVDAASFEVGIDASEILYKYNKKNCNTATISCIAGTMDLLTILTPKQNVII
jgi:hypothetical protein